MWVFFIGLKAQHQAGALLFAGGRALVQGLWLRSHPGLIGSAWIGTEQVSNQLQAIVDSNRLDERDRTAADILGLSEVSIHSINLLGGNNITQSGESLLSPNPCDHPGEDTTRDCKTDNCSSS